MATYYHGNSEIAGGGGGDGLQTLILMNPAYVGYSDAGQQPPSSNFVFLNSTSTVNTLPHAPPSNGHHLVGFQLQNTTSTSTAEPQEQQQQQQQQQHGFLQSVPYNLYNLPVENAAARAQQGLSLSLSSQHPPPGYGSLRASPPRREEVRASGGSPSPASGVSNGVESVLLSSKYLSAAQELLDEVVNVGKGAKTVVESSKGQAKSNGDSATAASGEAHSGGGDSSGKRGAELTTAERQEIQMKKAKLVNMLDEVEQRYRQYQQQMQMVITWFEQAAGTGAAKTYTAVALETISKQFRCLKDAIIGQIRGASKSLGEEENNNVEGGGSRLKYVDNQMRQQRALQQLGMIHHNAAWRPQRGLPERSVSVLRAWLFEHFLHPYPKDSDKLMLAKQTGLTRSQVSNWFINARVRLWKPMVEEMYTEEMKDHDKNGNANDTTTKIEQKNDGNPTTKSATTPQVKSPASEQQHNKTFVDNFINNNTVSPPPRSPTGTTMPSFNLISETGSSPKKLRISNMLQSTTTVAATIPPSISMDSKPDDSDNDTMLMKFGGGGERQDREGFTLMGAPTNFIGGFGAYPMGDLGRFGTEQFQTPYSGNGVSLTLGLPHCENIAMSGAHQSFLPNQTMQLGRSVEIGEANDFGGMDASANAHSANVYDINIQNRKRFAAQLLPDFVA